MVGRESRVDVGFGWHSLLLHGVELVEDAACELRVGNRAFGNTAPFQVGRVFERPAVLGVDAVEFLAGRGFHDGRQVEPGPLRLGQVEVGAEVVVDRLPEVAARQRTKAGNTVGADPVLHPVDDAALVAVVLGVEVHPVAAPAFEHHQRVIALENVPFALAQVLAFSEVVAEVAQQLGQLNLLLNLLEGEFVFHGKTD